MEPLDFTDLPQAALVSVDTAPTIYVLEGEPQDRDFPRVHSLRVIS